MNKNQFLIPANTKKGELIFGLFLKIDFIILIVGIGITLLSLVIISTTNHMDNFTSILAIAPGLIAAFLVFPFPNYHNIRTAIGEMVKFYTNRQRYIWRGWCSGYEFKDK